MADVHDTIREWWDRDSHTYDEAKSHAISDPLEAAAWRQALREALPEPPARVLDVGAGTGALSLLAADIGHRVTALDLSEGMLAVAKRKAAERGLELEFVVGSGSEPPTGPFDAVVERHVLWTLPDPDGVLRAWREVMAPGGRLVLFEGVWGQRDPLTRVRDLVAEALRSLMGLPDDHHAPYPDEVLRELPLARRTRRPVRVRTVVFGLVLLAISVISLVALLTDVRVDGGVVGLGLLIGAGVALVAGGIAAAAREAKGGPGAAR